MSRCTFHPARRSQELRERLGMGSRFTFVANEKTHFGGGANAMKDLKKDDHVTVLYQVQGSQYVALRVLLSK